MKKKHFKTLIRHLRQEQAEMHAKINDIARHTNGYPDSLEQIHAKINDIARHTNGYPDSLEQIHAKVNIIANASDIFKKLDSLPTQIRQQCDLLSESNKITLLSFYRSESETIRLLNADKNILNDYIKKGLLVVNSINSKSFYLIDQIQYILHNNLSKNL